MAREYKIRQREDKAKFTIDYASELNPQQYAAVSSKPGASLVIAGAGSGKTRTLTYRVAYLLDQGVDARNILLLTFTNKASKEMLERVRELVDRDISALWGGTFHSIGNRILRRHADELGFDRSFSILDSDDQKSLMKEVIKGCAVDSKNKRFPKPALLLSIFSLAINTQEELKDILFYRYHHLLEWETEIEKIAEAYQRKKLETNSMDFDDLLVLTLKLLKQDEDLLELYQKKFKYVLVDEYQDTNRVQCEIIDLLVAKSRNLMVVGDDAQSIYSWRGADMENILQFHRRYPEAKTYKIETNYRSQPEIIALSNAAIAANTEQIPKELRANRKGGEMMPALLTLNNPHEQADFVAGRVEELIDEGMEAEEIAVLYRAHYQSMEVQMEFTARKIPFQITSGLRFFEQAHVKDVSSFIRFVVNPRDEISFKRMLQLLPGVGPVTADKLWRAWRGCELATAADYPPKLYSDVMLDFKVPAKAKEIWSQLCYTLDELVGGPGGKGGFSKPGDMIRSVVEGVYEDYMKDSFDNHENRLQDLDALGTFAKQYDDVHDFLSQLSLMSNVDGGPGGPGGPGGKKQKKEEPSGVTLSSIHQAKGLEWKVVFLIWLADGMFPNGRVLESDDEKGLEEERRLFYVALTRAKDQLYLSYPMMNPRSFRGDPFQNPSRFLDDFPPELVEEWHVSGW